VNRRVRKLCLIAVAAVLLTVSAWIAIPTVPPFTLQTLAVWVIAFVLGRRAATAAVGLYLLLGAAGLPVFAGFTGGVGVLLGPTGGFLLGFLPMAWLAAWPTRTALRRLVAWTGGLLVCYVIGTVWYAGVYMTFSAGTLLSAAATCVLPYVLPDIAKMATASIVCRRLEKSFPLL